MGAMQKINDMFKSIFVNFKETTQQGKMYPNRSNLLYEQMQVEMDRMKSYNECWTMYNEDARIAAAIDTTAGSATNGSFTIQFNRAASSNEKIVEDADKIISDIKKKTKIDEKILGIAKELLILGDVFLEVIVDFKSLEIVGLKKLPARSIERIEDDFGELLGFVQKDAMGTVIAEFEPWQILHMRWNNFSGQRYGSSMIKAVRSAYKKLKMSEEDLVVRRRTRAGLKMHHYGTDKESPLEEWEVDEYMEKNQSTPLNVRTDWFSNGKWKIDVLASDDGVSQIDDIKHLEDTLFVGLRTPKGLLGIGEDTNKATLERQEIAYIRLLNEITNAVGDQFTQVFDLGLSLKGLSPDSVEYELVWGEKSVENSNSKAERLVLLTNAGFISKETATGQMGYNFDDEQFKIEREIEKYGTMDYQQIMNPQKFVDPKSMKQSAREKVKHQGRSDDGKENQKSKLSE
jgi:hypothetical protein